MPLLHLRQRRHIIITQLGNLNMDESAESPTSTNWLGNPLTRTMAGRAGVMYASSLRGVGVLPKAGDCSPKGEGQDP